jgi:hypothetical protein
MTYTFEDATPVTTAGPGRTAAPNPFTTVIKEIALKTREVDGKTVPVAKGFTVKHDADPDKRLKEIGRIKRQLSTAGHANTPDVTVESRAVPKKVDVKGKETDSLTESLLTFWTIAPVLRPRKPKVETVAEVPAEVPAS